MRSVFWTLLCAVVILAGLIAAGCKSVERAGDVRPSGFMRDYSMLKPGGDDQPQLYFRSPDFDPKAFDKVVIEPVTIWKEAGSTLKDLPPDEVEKLGQLFHTLVVREVGKVKTVVTKAGPRTLRVRLALTEATRGDSALNLVTTVVPQTHLLKEVTSLATGTRMFVGSAAGECEIMDASSGKIVAAGVGRLRGGEAVDLSFDNWEAVEEAMQFAAERVARELR